MFLTNLIRSFTHFKRNKVDLIVSSFYLKANLSRGFRAPNVAETGSNGVHDGTVIYEIGDPNLKPEQSLEVDIAPGLRTKDITFEVDLFSNSII